MEISVVVITRNRAEKLKACLEGLDRQLRLPNEIIVVDNHSSDSTKNVVENMTSKLNISYFIEPHIGTALARNTGIKMAKSEIVAFIDDDCIPHEDWVFHILKIMGTYPEMEAVGGKTIESGTTIYSELNQILFSFFIGTQDVSSNSLLDMVRRVIFPHPTDYSRSVKTLPTRNLAYRKSIFKKIGLFDEDFRLTGEDTEFNLRLYLNGFGLYYAPQILVTHCHQMNLHSFLKRYFNYGVMISLTKKKLPNALSWRIPVSFKDTVSFLLNFPFIYLFKLTHIHSFKKFIPYASLILLNEISFRFGIIWGIIKYNVLKNKRYD